MLGVHPFPARMAPELALSGLRDLPASAIVLDPMVGSGTVMRLAVNLGHTAVGFDLDPLAVLISRVATVGVDEDQIGRHAQRILAEAGDLDDAAVNLPWIDGNEQTELFLEYWFGADQRRDLRKLAFLLSKTDAMGVPTNVADTLRVALSRIIITKHQCASLAMDTSHSRPHRVATTSSYNVMKGFEQSVRVVRRRVASATACIGKSDITLGDARSLSTVSSDSIDAVVTSPPYLNAIDYMRGHRLSLVWLGHELSALSATRSSSIGSERKAESALSANLLKVRQAMGDVESLPPRFLGIVDRYVIDIHSMISEIFRVLKPGGRATFVVGDSCLRGVFVRNSGALESAAIEAGLRIIQRTVRDLPVRNRYLPTPATGALGKRMTQEVVLTFSKG